MTRTTRGCSLFPSGNDRCHAAGASHTTNESIKKSLSLPTFTVLSDVVVLSVVVLTVLLVVIS